MVTSEKQNAETLELLPCPFCGRSAHITEDDSRFFIGCDDCFCAVGEAYDGCAMPAHCFYEEEAAIDAWNNRAAASPHAGGAVMLELAEYLKEQAERLRRMLEREVVPGRPQFDSCLHAFTSAENTVRQIVLRAAVPSPHPMGEPVAWQWWSGIHLIEMTSAKSKADKWIADGNDVRALYAAPPPAGADAVQLQARPAEGGDWIDIYPSQLEWMAKEGHSVRAVEAPAGADAVREALVEILSHHETVGLGASIFQVSADVVRRARSALFPAPQPQEKPTGDQT